jgi:hypothetical protein
MLPWATRCHADRSGAASPGACVPGDRMTRMTRVIRLTRVGSAA